MGTRSLVLGLAACMLALLAASLQAGEAQANTEIVNPHDEPPEKCGSCHTAIPSGGGEYLLIKDGIDDTCHVCHPYDCCRIYALKGHNHPSNVGKWDVEKFQKPDNLPLHNGLITCNTCHFHRMPEGPNYRMVRIVKIGLDSVDWSLLCEECHRDYL